MTICNSCGSPTETGAAFCSRCGKPLKHGASVHADAMASEPAPAGAAGAAVAAPPSIVAAPSVSARNPFTWPFQQQNWPNSIWILLLAWIPVFGWIAALTLTEGWMIEASGRLARKEADPLPRAPALPRMFVHGIFFWVMLFLYVALPIWVLSAIFATETAIIAQQFRGWVTNSAENATITAVNVGLLTLGVTQQIGLVPQQTLEALVERWAAVYTAGFVLPVLWVLFAVPVFVAATIRFGITGKPGSYFHPIANTGFVFRHFASFAWLFLVIVAVNFVCALVPLLGFYLWLTVGVWLVAYYAGQLGTKLHPSEAHKPS